MAVKVINGVLSYELPNNNSLVIINGILYYYESTSSVVDYSLNIDSTSYNLSLTDINFVYSIDYDLTIDSVSYLLNNSDITLLKFNNFTIDSASYNLSLTDLGLFKTDTLSINPNSYLLTASDIALNYGNNKAISIDPVSYSLSLTDIGLLKTNKLSIDTNSYNLALTDINLAYTAGYSLSIDSAGYSLSLTDIVLLKTNKLDIASNDYGLVFNDVTLTYIAGYSLPIDSSAYVLAMSDVTLTLKASLNCENPYIWTKFSTGDSPIITIYNASNDSVVVNAAAMSELLTTGYFKYFFNPSPTVLTNYFYIASTAAKEVSGQTTVGGYLDSVLEDTTQIKADVNELHKLQGLDAANPLTVTPTSRVTGAISQTISGNGISSSTVQRD